MRSTFATIVIIRLASTLPISTPVYAQGQGSSALRLTRIESDADDASGRCPLFVAGYDSWDGMSLEYRVPWPVHLLLTKPVRLLLHSLHQTHPDRASDTVVQCGWQ
jgi:hypothetical protein